MRDDLGTGACKARFNNTLNFGGVPEESRRDERTTAERVADVLAESHREDTSAEFRLGLLQGALAIAMPEWIATTNNRVVVVNGDVATSEQLEARVRGMGRAVARTLARSEGKPAKRSRRHA